MSQARATSPSKDFPVRQLIILCECSLFSSLLCVSQIANEPISVAICRLCEPIAFCSIFPYIYYMIDSFGIAVRVILTLSWWKS